MRNFVKQFENPSVYSLLLVITILFTLSYWTYLYFTTEMVISQDAVGYENSARMVAEGGWKEYFRRGPDREPLYIFTVAFSMKMGEVFGLHYHHFQKLIQVMLLFVAQLLLLHVLNKLRIHNLLKILCVFYFGISPAIVNGAFSLYSEIMVYPLVLLALILLRKTWQATYEKTGAAFVQLSVATAACLLVLMLGKGIFRFISLISLLPFLSVFIRSLLRRDWRVMKNALIFVMTTIVIVQSGIFAIKSLNHKHNGQFTYTERYNFILLGSAIKRTRPLTKEIVLAHVASIPGTGICLKLYSKEVCEYADWYGSVTPYFSDLDDCALHASEAACVYAQRYRSTDLSAQAILDLLATYPEEKKHRGNFELALVRIAEHPFRFTFFTILEAFKMFFWESTRIGFVSYPPWLENFFTNPVARYGLRFGVSFLTILSYVYLLIFSFRARHKLFDRDLQYERERTAFLILLIITVFLGVYGACCVLTRYSLPISGLYVLSIALFLDNVFRKKERTS